jgi:hypothetical protein
VADKLIGKQNEIKWKMKKCDKKGVLGKDGVDMK